MRGSDNDMLAAAIPLIEAGIAVHWLRRHSKAPVEDGWQKAPVHTVETLTASYRRGYNLGIRPGEFSKTAAGYVHLFDIDIRDAGLAHEAHAVMDRLWPEWRDSPYAISGSGGESRHHYFTSAAALRSKTLAHSEGFTLVYDAKKERNVKKYDWEVALFGAPKQAVLPPSIHPDTGNPYVWGREFDLEWLAMGVGPTISAERIESWGVREDDLNLDEDDDLMAAVRAAPMGLTDEEVERTLRDLPEEWVYDRDQWYQVGMALHHEYEGAAKAFEIWDAWSKQVVDKGHPEKYDRKDQITVWKSFKGASNPVRMATLIKAAGEERDRREMDWMDSFDAAPANDWWDELQASPSTTQALVPAAVATEALDDLFGPSSTPAPSIAPGAFGELEPADPEWKSYFDRNEDGDVKPTVHNVELILRHDPRMRGIMAFNEFNQEIVLVRQPKVSKEARRRGANKPLRDLDSPIWVPKDQVNGSLWSDSHDNNLRLLIETPRSQGGYQLKTSDRDLRTAVDVVAQKRRFHPVRSYLNGLKWDGTRRVEQLFSKYLGSPDDDYHREAAMLFMIGAVTRVFEPGHKFDFVPILEGLQGKRKSTFIRVLGRHWFSELEGDFHDKKSMVEAMQGSWILEIPELQGFSKAEVTTIKGFVSRTVDKVRLSYAKRAGEFPRQCVFIGSTNDDEYLRDQTGGRRFWVIVCNVEEIDTDGLELEIDQFWAEAAAMYHEWRRRNPAGTLPLYMRNEMAAREAKRLQESRRQDRAEDVLAGRIETWLNSPVISGELDAFEPETYRTEVCLIQIWVEMMDRDANSYTDRDQQLLARSIRRVEGWRPGGRQQTKYGRQRIFIKED